MRVLRPCRHGEGVAVPTSPAPDITRLLLAWRQGDADALDTLLPLVYSELRKIAHARMRGELPRSRMLQTTALVHEAYIRLVDGRRVDWQNRTHFYAVCARLMRRILVDRARARRSVKRGGQMHAGACGEGRSIAHRGPDELLALDEALRRLVKAEPRMEQVVELRYFGGLTTEETAEALGISRDTVIRDWNAARLWLRHELRGATSGVKR